MSKAWFMKMSKLGSSAGSQTTRLRCEVMALSRRPHPPKEWLFPEARGTALEARVLMTIR